MVAESLPTRAERRSLAVNLTPAQNSLIQEAARQRNMSLSSFMRRAALAVAAFDCGLTIEEVFENEQLIAGFEGQGKAPRLPAAGRDFGPWRIERMTR
jgi:hypothetical protein